MTVLNKGQADLRVHITQHIKIQAGNITLDFNNILFAAFLAAHVLQQGHAGFVQLFQLQQVIQRKPGPGGNVVNDHAVHDFINIQHSKATSPVLGSFSPSSVIIKAMRTYTPFCACSK